MIAEFRLPDLGEGLPEAEIVQWLVAPGDTVTLNQPIAEVETAKAIVELPSPFAGVVSALHAAEGEVIEVGNVLIAIELAGSDAGEDSTAPDTSALTETAASAPEAAIPNLVGYGAPPRGTGRPQRKIRALRAGGGVGAGLREPATPAVASVAALTETRRETPRSTPPVRTLAKELGIDLALVAASGVTGIIRREDVERYALSQAAPVRTPERQGGARSTRTPIRGVRKHTAAAMVRSAFTAPHVTIFLEVDVTATTALVADLRADRRLRDHRIGIFAVAAKAACAAVKAEPTLNSRWDEAAGEIELFHYVNLGVAAATERGLIVPHIPDADTLTLVELADAITELAEVARAGRTGSAALSGGTFTITNFGVFGVDAGTPILNPGEAGILGLGTVRSRPWAFEGQVVLRDVMTLSLSFDHRLVDGEQAARFVRAVGDVLSEPGRAMLYL